MAVNCRIGREAKEVLEHWYVPLGLRQRWHCKGFGFFGPATGVMLMVVDLPACYRGRCYWKSAWVKTSSWGPVFWRKSSKYWCIRSFRLLNHFIPFRVKGGYGEGTPPPPPLPKHFPCFVCTGARTENPLLLNPAPPAQNELSPPILPYYTTNIWNLLKFLNRLLFSSWGTCAPHISNSRIFLNEKVNLHTTFFNFLKEKFMLQNIKPQRNRELRTPPSLDSPPHENILLKTLAVAKVNIWCIGFMQIYAAPLSVPNVPAEKSKRANKQNMDCNAWLRVTTSPVVKLITQDAGKDQNLTYPTHIFKISG